MLQLLFFLLANETYSFMKEQLISKEDLVMEMKRYKLEVSNENADKVVEIIERDFSHKISNLRKRCMSVFHGETHVNFSSDDITVVDILKTIDGLYNRVVCITDKYPEMDVLYRTKSMSAMANAQDERLMNEIRSLVEA